MKEYIVQNDIDNPTNSHGYMFGRTISQLIRCKDCKFYWAENHVCAEIGADDGVCHVHVSDYDFCSYGERKEE